MPSFGISLLTATLPVILMLISTIVQLVTGHEDPTNWFEINHLSYRNSWYSNVNCGYLCDFLHGCNEAT